MSLISKDGEKEKAVEITEDTKWVSVYISASFTGDYYHASRNTSSDIYIGDVEGVDKKKIEIWKRVQEIANIHFDIGYVVHKKTIE